MLEPGSKISEIYDGALQIEDRHRHRYEVDAKYRDQLESAGRNLNEFSRTIRENPATLIQSRPQTDAAGAEQ